MVRFLSQRPARRSRVCHPRLRVEVLEDRYLLSTTVTPIGGLLSINSSDNQVTIAEVSSGSYSVQAATLNGGAAQTFTGVTDISFIGSANQTVIFNGVSSETPSADTTTLTGNLAIATSAAVTVDVNANFNVAGSFSVNHSGNGSLAVNVIGSDITLGATTITDKGSAGSNIVLQNGAQFTSFVSINLGAAANNVTLGGTGASGVGIGGFLSIISGAGNDTVAVTGSTIGSAFGMSLASGTNNVSISSTTIVGNLFTSDSGTENFTLHNSSTVQGYVSLVYGSGGPANVTIGGGTGAPDVVIGSFLSVETGAGADTVSLTNTSVGSNFGFALGSGTNKVTVNQSTISGNLFGSDSGAETFTLATNSTVGGFVSLNFPSSTSANITIGGATYPTATINGFLSIITGAGATTVAVTGTLIDQNFAMALGSGADSVTLTSDNALANLTLIGTGTDTVVFTNTTVGANLLVNQAGATTAENISMQGGSVVGSTQMITGAGADTIAINDAVFTGAVGISTGNGTDQVNIETTATSTDNTDSINTAFYGPMLVTTGTGNSTVALGTSPTDLAVFYSTATFDGGTGATNTFTNTDALFLGGAPIKSNYP